VEKGMPQPHRSARALAMTASPPIAHEPESDEAAPATGPAIDRAHLARMTLGDRALELQVLDLFDRQAQLLLGRMPLVAPSGVAALAHTLSGSARGIGAWRVAAAAAALERAAANAGTAGGAADLDPAVRNLAATIAEARLAIGAAAPPVPA
jgi:HPt (histidine-containing phosphotransfer) domain-containing protein